MQNFQTLTNYIPLLNNDNIGSWVVDDKNDGTKESPIQLPFVNYTTLINHFIEDVLSFCEENKEYNLNQYRSILQKNNIEWDLKSMSNCDLKGKDTQCILALIVGAVRAEKFCDGALLHFTNNGCIKKWLIKLTELNK